MNNRDKVKEKKMWRDRRKGCKKNENEGIDGEICCE